MIEVNLVDNQKGASRSIIVILRFPYKIYPYDIDNTKGVNSKKSLSVAH